MSDNTSGFDPHKKDGVYLISVEPTREGYKVIGATKSGDPEQTHVAGVRANGHYISGEFECECSDFEIVRDRGVAVINLHFNNE